MTYNILCLYHNAGPSSNQCVLTGEDGAPGDGQQVQMVTGKLIQLPNMSISI